MGSFFDFAIECGPTKLRANAIAMHFSDFKITLPRQLPSSWCRTALWNDKEDWWCSVLPSGVSITGRADNTIVTKEGIYKVAMSLYSHLKRAPEFRYAVCGFDVTPYDFYTYLTSEKGKQHPPFRGFVMAEYIWKLLECPKGFRKFSNGFVWYPLRLQDVE